MQFQYWGTSFPKTRVLLCTKGCTGSSHFLFPSKTWRPFEEFLLWFFHPNCCCNLFWIKLVTIWCQVETSLHLGMHPQHFGVFVQVVVGTLYILLIFMLALAGWPWMFFTYMVQHSHPGVLTKWKIKIVDVQLWSMYHLSKCLYFKEVDRLQEEKKGLIQLNRSTCSINSFNIIITWKKRTIILKKRLHWQQEHNSNRNTCKVPI